VDPDAAADGVLVGAARLRGALPRTWEASLSEREALAPRPGRASVDAAELAAARLTLAGKPLAVLTAGGRGNDAGPAQAWREGHDRIAALSTRGRNTIIANAGHTIQVDQPRAVIAAVRSVVEAARGE